MLELRDVSFRVSEDSKEKEKGILEHVSFTLEDNKFVAITGPNGGENPHWQKLLRESRSPQKDGFSWMEKTLQTGTLQKEQDMVSAMHFSSRFVSKV